MIPLPETFLYKQQKLLGSEYPNFIKSYDEPATKGLRVNTLKIAVEDFIQLSPFSLQPVPWAKEGFYYSETDRPGKHPYHAAGLYYIQEPSAMAVVEILDPKPYEKVLDIAAAPGGKATQIATKMHNKGLLIANEVHPIRAKALSENVERLGITNTIVTNEEVHNLSKRFPSYFDRILLDAPCSGEGMFRKDEDSREQWSLESVEQCSIRQKQLLELAASMLKPGGKLVYSTCTFSPEENEQVIDAFLQNHSDFRLVPIPHEHGFQPGNPLWSHSQDPRLTGTARLWPHHLKGEGHFIATLEKIAGEPSLQTKKNAASQRGTKPLQEALHWFHTFSKETFTQPIEFPKERYALFGTQLYLLPENAPDLTQLKVLRAGLHLGEWKKNRFEPSHSLALTLTANEVKSSISYPADHPDLYRYLRGEAIESKETLSGWTLLLVDQYPLAWTKAVSGVLKNHYPKGLRWLG